MFDNLKAEDDLKADGFVLTVNKFHTGKGDGKVYEKVVEGARVFFGVDVDGIVSPWTPASGNVVVDVIAPSVVEPVQGDAEQPADVEPAGEIVAPVVEPVETTDEDQPKVEDAD